MQSLGDILQHQPTPGGRRGEPVRRESRAKGREGTFWRPTTRQDVRQLILAARRYDMAGRQGGQRNGPLGHVALEVLELLAHLVDFRSGRLDPALDTIAAEVEVAIDGDDTLGGIATDTILQSTTKSVDPSGDRRTGHLTLTYAVRAMTAIGDPHTAA